MLIGSGAFPYSALKVFIIYCDLPCVNSMFFSKLRYCKPTLSDRGVPLNDAVSRFMMELHGPSSGILGATDLPQHDA